MWLRFHYSHFSISSLPKLWLWCAFYMSELLILASFVVIVNFLTSMRKHCLKGRPVWERHRALLTTSRLAFLVCDRHQSSRIQSPAWETLRAGERAWWNCFKKNPEGSGVFENCRSRSYHSRSAKILPLLLSLPSGGFCPFFFGPALGRGVSNTGPCAWKFWY